MAHRLAEPAWKINNTSPAEKGILHLLAILLLPASVMKPDVDLRSVSNVNDNDIRLQTPWSPREAAGEDIR